MCTKLHVSAYTRNLHILSYSLSGKVPGFYFKHFTTICYTQNKYLLKQERLQLTALIQRSMRSYSDTVNYNSTNNWSTIFSLSSGHGKCGVAVVRISGPCALHALTLIAQLKHAAKPREATLKKLIDPETGVVIDKGLVIAFPGEKL
jgi:hypothetical protein